MGGKGEGDALGRRVAFVDAHGSHPVALHADVCRVAAAEDAVNAEAGTALPLLGDAANAHSRVGGRPAVLPFRDGLRDCNRHGVD